MKSGVLMGMTHKKTEESNVRLALLLPDERGVSSPAPAAAAAPASPSHATLRYADSSLSCFAENPRFFFSSPNCSLPEDTANSKFTHNFNSWNLRPLARVSLAATAGPTVTN